MQRIIILVCCTVVSASSIDALGQHHHSSRVIPPKVFLDKSPRVVEYQLSRLSNEQLLLIETNQQDPKFKPVFNAILMREGMDQASRISALDGLVALAGSNRTEQIVLALTALKNKDSGYIKTLRSLGEIFIDSLPQHLNSARGPLIELIDAKGLLAEIGYAGLASLDATAAMAEAKSRQQMATLFRAIPSISHASRREAFRQLAVEQLSIRPVSRELHQAALIGLSAMPQDDSRLVLATFAEVARLIGEPELRHSVIQTLLVLSPQNASAEMSKTLCEWLVNYAEQSSPADRTSDAFLDAMQLAEKLLPTIDASSARALRDRLRKTTVRIIRIKTVEEQMRYDTAHFAVQAGSDVQIVLTNLDIVPHNLVITTPGSLKEVALLSAEAGPNIGPSGKQFVAQDDRVLFASSMVPAQEQERLTIKAPMEVGEYPYVCTFPGHWMRMYGVMVVVNDLDAWLHKPQLPKDPLGNNRQFVKNWTTDDFADGLEANLRGRNYEVGKRLFSEASCAQCHRAGSDFQEGKIGPDLSETLAKWKGDKLRVIREIVEPSYHIDPAYAMHVVLTDSGTTISGMLVEETDKSISLLESMQSTKPTVIDKDTVEAHQKSSNSMMPKGLLDQFSRDEVLEIVAFILSVQKSHL